MRRKDFRGENECRGVWLEIRVRIWRREVGWKIAGSRRFCWGGEEELVRVYVWGEGAELTVIKRVFEGGDGEIRDGSAERSRERGVPVDSVSGVDAAEDGGDALGSDIPARRTSGQGRCWKRNLVVSLKDWETDSKCKGGRKSSRWRSHKADAVNSQRQ